MGLQIAVAGERPPSFEWIDSGVWAEISKHAPPPGFHYVVADHQEIVQPVALYLRDTFLRSRRFCSVGNTQRAYCADLYEWFSYLEAAKLRWDTACIRDAETYRDQLMSNRSPVTGRQYAPATVRRRLITILGFYEWAHRVGLVAEAFESKELRRMPRNFAHDAMAHIHGGDHLVAVSRILPKDYDEDHVNALSLDNLQRVLDALGPKPGDKDDARPRRDRIIAFLSVATGMRVHECVSLTLNQFLGVVRDPHYGNYRLKITITKGLRPRTVILPPAAYDEVLSYVDTERAEAVRGMRRPPDSLFVNSKDSPRNPGRPVTTHTVSRNFHRAVIEVGLFQRIKEEGREDRLIANHSFHDLRHTYAVTMYFSLAKQSNFPWLPLSRLLGHKQIRTTIDIYLRSVGHLEPAITDMVDGYLKALRDG